MDLHPSPDQQEIVGLFTAIFTGHCTPETVRDAEPVGHDAGLWKRLVEAGAVDMAVGEDAASLLDLALVAEQHGRFLAPTPMLEVWVASRLLDRVGAYPGAVALDAVTDGSRTVTLGVRPVTSAGSARLVPAGAVAHDAIVFASERLLLVPLAGRATPVANIAALPLADVEVGEATVLCEGTAAVEAYEAAVDEWRVLAAAALVGLARGALEEVVGYVKVRKAFGQPVGQFQAIQHRLADRVTDTDGAELLSREAAWAAASAPERFRTLAAMALAFAAETAVTTSHDAVQFHGGYGFTQEYPVQLHYRRARGWSGVLESPANSYRRVAVQRLGTATEGAV